LDVVKTADWLIDMGPEGGTRGGLVIAEGRPEDVARNPDSYTGQFLRPILQGRDVPAGGPPPELLLTTGPVTPEKPTKKAPPKKAHSTAPNRRVLAKKAS
ncbi:MAG: hypothetical protein H0T91_00570, partial [Propionibacteriaceae bacterium]|nr:hypothetical protein [Propionibacteriaceae bacterium]